MKSNTGFWLGMSAGLMTGAAAAWMFPGKRMKTPVGRGIQKVGSAMDSAVDNFISDLR